MHTSCIEDLQGNVFSRRNFTRITSKVVLIADNDASMVAEDDKGRIYDYGKKGFPSRRPKPSAAEWLGVTPKPDQDDHFIVVIDKSGRKRRV
jgi:hypothetical protein